MGSSGDSPFRAFSAKSEASSISAEKLNLLELMDRGEAVLLGEKLKRASSLSKLCLGESCLMDLVCFSALRTCLYIPLHSRDYLKKTSIKINVTTDEGNSRNEIRH